MKTKKKCDYLVGVNFDVQKIMIKKIRFLVVVCCFLPMFCLAKKNPTVSDRGVDNLFGKVKNVQTIEYAVVVQNKEVQKGEIATRSVKSYNPAGYITENIDFDSDNAMFQKEISVFDKKGNKIEELLYNENNELEQRTKMKYDAQKLPIQIVFEDNKGKKIQQFTYRYNELGYLTQFTGYDNRGKMSEKSYYTYDTHGNLVKYIGYGEFDNRKIYYKYDANRKITEQLCTDIKGDFVEKIVYQYENNGKLEKCISIDLDNNVLSTTISIYDDYNNLLEFTHFDKNGLVTERHEFVYQYDKYNNWTKQIFYSGVEKTALSITERVIEYYE